jgi:hypothetical protein
MFFFCNTWVHSPLFHLLRLHIQRTLFCSPYFAWQANSRHLPMALRIAEGNTSNVCSWRVARAPVIGATV